MAIWRGAAGNLQVADDQRRKQVVHLARLVVQLSLSRSSVMSLTVAGLISVSLRCHDVRCGSPPSGEPLRAASGLREQACLQRRSRKADRADDAEHDVAA
mgnify:CR=1 FL=1